MCQIPKNRISFVFSTILGFTGVFLVLSITAKYGVGVSGDSIDYLSTADNLIRYHRFVDYNNAHYIYWPPLYPLLLAGMSLITGFDTFLVARILNAVFFGLIIFLTGILFHRSFHDYPMWAFLGILISFTSLPILRIASNITSDPFFIVLILFFVLLGNSYLSKPGFSRLLGLAIIAGIAAILRWHGVTLIMSVVIIALYANRENLKTALLNGFLVGGMSSTPFLLWILGRNYRLYGTLLGKRDLSVINYLSNLSDSIVKISDWILPDLITRHVSPITILIVFLVFIILSNRWGSIRKIFIRLTSNLHLPWVIFAIINYIFVIFTSFTTDHSLAYDDRYYTPLFIFFFLSLAIIFTEVILKPLDAWLVSQRFKFNLANIILVMVVGIWLIFPSYRVYKYVIVSREHGEPTYNLYNSQEFNESKVIRFLLKYEFNEDKPIYSNFSGAVYFFTREITLPAPHSAKNRNDIDYMKTQYQDWPHSGDAYLIFFLPNYWKHYYTPQELSSIAELTEIFTSKDGSIYLVRQR